MNDAAVEKALRTYITQNWNETEVAWDAWGNFYKPKLGTPYLCPKIVAEIGGAVGKGGTRNFYRFENILQLELRVPLQMPEADRADLRDAVTALFRAKLLAGIGRFHVPVLQGGGPLRDDAWLVYVYEVTFWRDESEDQP